MILKIVRERENFLVHFTSKDEYQKLLIYIFTSISRSEMGNSNQKEKVCRSNSASFHLHQSCDVQLIKAPYGVE